MAEQSKVLKVLNDAVDIVLDKDWNGAIGVEYGPKGEDGIAASTGTVVFEGTLSGVNWYGLKITLPDATKVDNFAAVGIGSVEVLGYNRVRMRMSVAGGAQGVKVFANQKKG